MKLFSLVLFFLAFFLLRTSADDVTSVISSSLFDQMLKYRNDPRCKSNGFYTYNAFVDAAKSFNGFGTTGDITTRKREIAAFFGQTSHETTGQLLTFCLVCYKMFYGKYFQHFTIFVQEGGQVHQMAHTRGDIALLPKLTSKPIARFQINGHVLLANNIMVEDLSNSLSKSFKSSISSLHNTHRDHGIMDPFI